MGTHHNPSDVLTKIRSSRCSRSASPPELNLFKDSSLSQVHKYCFGVQKIKAIKFVKEDINTYAHAVLSRVDQHACDRLQDGSIQGRICMLDFDVFQDQQEILTQRFKAASVRIRRAFTPLPR